MTTANHKLLMETINTEAIYLKDQQCLIVSKETIDMAIGEDIVRFDGEKVFWSNILLIEKLEEN